MAARFGGFDQRLARSSVTAQTRAAMCYPTGTPWLGFKDPVRMNSPQALAEYARSKTHFPLPACR